MFSYCDLHNFNNYSFDMSIVLEIISKNKQIKQNTSPRNASKRGLLDALDVQFRFVWHISIYILPWYPQCVIILWCII